MAVLTGGGDRPYALGLAAALIEQNVSFDFIASNDLDSPELHGNPQVRFLNLRGDQGANASPSRKALRVLVYYWRLLVYAVVAKPRLFHLLWNNKFEFFDRTFLMSFYRLLGKRIIFTAHNVNAGERDAADSFWNRFSLRTQYRLCHHIFVHTRRMQQELVSQFGVPESRVTVIPFGINNTLPNTALSSSEARQAFGLGPQAKTILFFGMIAPYKGLEYLVAAFTVLAAKSAEYRLVIAGRPKNCPDYWAEIQRAVVASGAAERVIQRIDYIPDEQVERFFKAAHVLVLPYAHVFQSGVLFLSYSFGLPVVAADVGAMKDDIVEGETGLVFKPGDTADLARALERYFSSDLFQNLPEKRARIQEYANERYSWTKVGEITKRVYGEVL